MANEDVSRQMASTSPVATTSAFLGTTPCLMMTATASGPSPWLMPIGYTGAYTFTNGACGDWSCKENIVGQPCAFGTWSDRELPEVTGDATLLDVLFAVFTSDGTCASVTASDVTFRVDMSEQTVTDGVFLHAAFDGWGVHPDDGRLER